MTYIKIDSEFLPLEKVADDSRLPIEIIEDCVNFDLLSKDTFSSHVNLEIANKIRRFRIFCALRAVDLPASVRNYIMEIAEKYPRQKAVDLAKKEMELCSIDAKKSQQIAESVDNLFV